MKTTFDATADAAYISLIPVTERGQSVRTVEVETVGGSVILDFSESGTLLGLEVLGATAVLDESIVAAAERIGG